VAPAPAAPPAPSAPEVVAEAPGVAIEIDAPDPDVLGDVLTDLSTEAADRLLDLIVAI
jgi:hypothetical protein